MNWPRAQHPKAARTAKHSHNWVAGSVPPNHQGAAVTNSSRIARPSGHVYTPRPRVAEEMVGRDVCLCTEADLGRSVEVLILQETLEYPRALVLMGEKPSAVCCLRLIMPCGGRSGQRALRSRGSHPPLAATVHYGLSFSSVIAGRQVKTCTEVRPSGLRRFQPRRVSFGDNKLLHQCARSGPTAFGRALANRGLPGWQRSRQLPSRMRLIHLGIALASNESANG